MQSADDPYLGASLEEVKRAAKISYDEVTYWRRWFMNRFPLRAEPYFFVIPCCEFVKKTPEENYIDSLRALMEHKK